MTELPVGKYTWAEPSAFLYTYIYHKQLWNKLQTYLMDTMVVHFIHLKARPSTDGKGAHQLQIAW